MINDDQSIEEILDKINAKGLFRNLPINAEHIKCIKFIIDEYYNLEPSNACGGSLHIVLDDHNIDNDSIKFCEDFARKRNDTAGVKLARFLITLTEADRRKIIIER